MKSKNLIKNSFLIFVSVVFVAMSILLLAPKPYECLAESDDNNEVEELYFCEDGFSNIGTQTTVTETFTYSTKETVTTIQINNTFPAYYNKNSNLSNECACVAGANLIGYYDRYFENLIPNHSPGVKRGTAYYYNSMNTNLALKQAVIDDLYVRMGTNVSQSGTTQSGFQNGLSSYVQSKGYSLSYSSIMSGSTLNIQSLIQSLNDKKPVALLLQGFNLSQISDSNGTTTLTKYTFTGNHIVIVYGLTVVNYYDSTNTLVKVKTYLSVASGLEDYTGYYILNNNGSIVGANAVEIS